VLAVGNGVVIGYGNNLIPVSRCCIDEIFCAVLELVSRIFFAVQVKVTF
jgi:hypothetical protein